MGLYLHPDFEASTQTSDANSWRCWPACRHKNTQNKAQAWIIFMAEARMDYSHCWCQCFQMWWTAPLMWKSRKPTKEPEEEEQGWWHHSVRPVWPSVGSGTTANSNTAGPVHWHQTLDVSDDYSTLPTLQGGLVFNRRSPKCHKTKQNNKRIIERLRKIKNSKNWTK